MNKTQHKLFDHLANWLNSHMSGSRKAVFGKDNSQLKHNVFNVMITLNSPTHRDDAINISLYNNYIGYISLSTKDTGLFFNVEHASKDEFNEEVCVADPESYEKVLKIIESWPIVNYKFGFSKWK